ncbi:hypothetical protein AAFC00_005455 [Neodothiora populina]|uniref:C6 transcription factor n=1 Tax=Neodothiora populina TaxID=2781224 RepID=A0ABR3PKY2_9PEZI
MLEEMCLAITDPFLGFCTAIAATVFLQFSLADGSPISGVAEAGLIRAKEVMQSLSSRWPILSKVSELLRGLEQIEKAQARTASVTTPQTEAAREALIWRVLLFDAAKEAEPAPETIFAETMGPRRDEQTLQPVHPAIADTSANTGFVPSAADPPLQTRVDPLMAPPFSRLTPVDGIVQPDLLSMADMMGASPARAFDEWWSYGPL